MKPKMPNGKFEICTDCKRELNTNECETHATNRQQVCYFCHLHAEHTVEWVDDKQPTEAVVGDGGNV